MKNNPIIDDLLLFLDQSPTAWHAVENITQQLIEKGFKELVETERWLIEPGQSYFLQRNNSSLCAFITPTQTPQKIKLLASHTDSPSLKIKPKPEIRKFKSILLGVEVYGAPLLSSWLNRDLGLAGRIIYSDHHNKLHERLVNLTDHPLIIPQLAIHLDREVNEKGLLLNKQEHLNALAALEIDLPEHDSYLKMLLSQKIDLKDLIEFDLFLYPLEKARLIGFQEQLIASYRIDSLASVHAILTAFLKDTGALESEIKMVMFWDNEEIGSHTAQGAESTFFNQIIERLTYALKMDKEDYFRLINRSTCISIDLAHALSPNYADKHDPQHQPLLGQGIIIKHNAQQRYATDARSSSAFQLLGNIKQIPLQKFVSRNDMPCGSTIGPLHSCLSGMPTVDIGCGQLSMHSSREVMACRDHLWLCELLEAFLAKYCVIF